MKYFIRRALAYLIDCAICFSIVMLVVQWAVLSHIRVSIGITDEWFTNSWNMMLYVLLSISLPVWWYFAYFDSKKAKGSIGKRIMKLSVLGNDDEKISLGKSFLRTLLKLAPWEIAHLGVMFPVPLYFAENPDIRILTIAGSLLFFVYMVSIVITVEGRAIYDKLMGTKVVGR